MRHVDPYLSAEALEITEAERAGLIGLMREFSGEVDISVFDMRNCHDCINGHLDRRLARGWTWSTTKRAQAMTVLCSGNGPYWDRNPILELKLNTPAEAAKAIHRFLTEPLSAKAPVDVVF